MNLVQVKFNKGYNRILQVLVNALNLQSTQMNVFPDNRTDNSFEIYFVGTLAVNSVYRFEYLSAQ